MSTAFSRTPSKRMPIRRATAVCSFNEMFGHLQRCRAESEPKILCAAMHSGYQRCEELIVVPDAILKMLPTTVADVHFQVAVQLLEVMLCCRDILNTAYTDKLLLEWSILHQDRDLREALERLLVSADASGGTTQESTPGLTRSVASRSEPSILESSTPRGPSPTGNDAESHDTIPILASPAPRSPPIIETDAKPPDAEGRLEPCSVTKNWLREEYRDSLRLGARPPCHNSSILDLNIAMTRCLNDATLHCIAQHTDGRHCNVLICQDRTRVARKKIECLRDYRDRKGRGRKPQLKNHLPQLIQQLTCGVHLRFSTSYYNSMDYSITFPAAPTICVPASEASNSQRSTADPSESSLITAQTARGISKSSGQPLSSSAPEGIPNGDETSTPGDLSQTASPLREVQIGLSYLHLYSSYMETAQMLRDRASAEVGVMTCVYIFESTWPFFKTADGQRVQLVKIGISGSPPQRENQVLRCNNRCPCYFGDEYKLHNYFRVVKPFHKKVEDLCYEELANFNCQGLDATKIVPEIKVRNHREWFWISPEDAYRCVKRWVNFVNAAYSPEGKMDKFWQERMGVLKEASVDERMALNRGDFEKHHQERNLRLQSWLERGLDIQAIEEFHRRVERRGYPA